MALIVKPYTFTAGTTILSAEVNSSYDTIYSDYNGNITDANIAAGAAISTSKISGTVMTRTANETVTGNKTFTGTNEFNTGVLTVASAMTLSGVITATGVFAGATPIILEGATADASETSIAVVDPTADRTLTIGNEDCNLAEQAVKGWVQFNGTGVIAIGDSFNVTSITDNGTGDYTINWTTAFINDDYCASGSCGNSGSGNIRTLQLHTFAVGSVRIITRDGSNPADVDFVCVQAIGSRV